MKFLAILPAAAIFAAPAVAGPYVNTESNSSWYGADALGTVIELHGGYEGEITEGVGYYVQAGPALVLPEGGSNDTQFSGKAGVVADVTDELEVYGEYAFITGDEFGSNVKVGATYRF
jgi:outer membrane receptor protein involved in Fe transport